MDLPASSLRRTLQGYPLLLSRNGYVIMSDQMYVTEGPGLAGRSLTQCLVK